MAGGDASCAGFGRCVGDETAADGKDVEAGEDIDDDLNYFKSNIRNMECLFKKCCVEFAAGES